jgi:cob(I)alamin adenosyltransferase
MKIYTKRGDDGTTGLLFGGRVDKNDARTEAYGTLDEVVSVLGLARSFGLCSRVAEIVVRVQREMFVAGAQLATAEDNQSKLKPGVSRVTPEMVGQLESDIDALVAAHPPAAEFILPGETSGAAGLDLARTVARRAERLAAGMSRSGIAVDPILLAYLNRVSDLIYALARYEEAERGRSAPPSRERG